MALVFCMLSHDALHLCKFHENILNGFQVTGWTWVYDGNHCLQCSNGCVCVEVLRPSRPNAVMSSAVNLSLLLGRLSPLNS